MVQIENYDATFLIVNSNFLQVVYGNGEIYYFKIIINGRGFIVVKNKSKKLQVSKKNDEPLNKNRFFLAKGAKHLMNRFFIRLYITKNNTKKLETVWFQVEKTNNLEGLMNL